MAVRHPFLINKHKSKFCSIIISIFIYAFVYNLPRFFVWEIGQEMCEKYDYDYDPSKNVTCDVTFTTEFGKNQVYKWVYINTYTTVDIKEVPDLICNRICMM